jgi:hypothetical protein
VCEEVITVLTPSDRREVGAEPAGHVRLSADSCEQQSVMERAVCGQSRLETPSNPGLSPFTTLGEIIMSSTSTPSRILVLTALGLFTGTSAAMLQGCDPDGGVCGPCGSLATGEVTIAGNARLDGFFAAVVQIRDATARIKADFDADILALAEVYGVAKGEVDASFVAQLTAAIEADVQAHTRGGLRIRYEGPKCQASLSAGIEAQASCEAQAGCDVEVSGGEVSVQCEGTCSGTCDAGCSGSLSCAVKTPTVGCEGLCEGTCELDGMVACEGTCHGQCMGTCSMTNAAGDCAGECDGNCRGTCEIAGTAECQGTCHGTCYVDQGSAQCTAEAECSGSCSGSCSGGCEGSFTPPSASAQCEASADCQAQAKAQAEASLECTPPSLAIDFELQANLDASASAAFIGRIKELRVRSIAILQGAARLRALIDGRIDGEVVFDPSPFARLRAEVEGLIEAGASGDIAIPPGRIACVVPAFQEAGRALAAIGAEGSATVSAQAELTAFLLGG